MRLDTAKKIFAHMMQVARTRPLGPIEKKGLAMARQTLRRAARPAMNPRKRAPWMPEKSTPTPTGVNWVYGIFVHSGEGNYRFENAIKIFKTRKAADKYVADNDPHSAKNWVVREVYAPDKKNKPEGATLIYGRCLRIEAVKMVKHNYGGEPVQAGQKYFHDFTSKNAVIYGLPDGSLLIKAK